MADEYNDVDIHKSDVWMSEQTPYSEEGWVKFIERIKSGELVVFRRVKQIPPAPDGPDRIYGEGLGDDRI